jgi:hypothetical protein
MSRRRTWGHGRQDHEIQVMVRCRGNRFIGAGVAVPTDWPGVDLQDSLRIAIRGGVVEFTAERGPLGPIGAPIIGAGTG